MNDVFRQHVDALHGKFEALVKMTPVTPAAVLKDAEKSGIYLLSERDRHLYVGRTRNNRDRLKGPVGHYAGASFAVKLARLDPAESQVEAAAGGLNAGREVHRGSRAG